MGDDVRQIEQRVKKKTRDDVKVFLIGCVGYSALEILWRGFTHWSMALTGGGCMVAIYELNCRHPQLPLWKKCLAGDGIITAAELAVGCVVNLWMDWHVWDYSDLPLNFLGQISLLYSCLWFLLCMPLCGMSRKLQQFFGGARGGQQAASRLEGQSHS